jgi:peptidoglycan/xylan/chitin deacetylase (PgdA/CDA1 family)
VLATALLAGLAPASANGGPTPAERRCGNTTNKVELTFDDSADPARVNAFLDVLADRHVRAGFFILGPWAAAHPDVMARIRREGHWLGNHTATHPVLSRLSDDRIRQEIAHGVPAALLRPPYGAMSDRVRAVAAGAGYRLCLWGVDTNDWRGRSADQIQATVFSGLRPGAVVLMHLHGRNTLAALPGLIDGIRARGFELDGASPFPGATVDASGAPLLLQRDGALIGADGGTVVAGDVSHGDAVAVSSRGAGGWIVGADGDVYTYGDAPYLGGDRDLNAPVTGIASTPQGGGYWSVGADGGVFAHGDAGFYGSLAGTLLNDQIVAIVASPTGGGYWLLGRDGGVFAFGDAPFFGAGSGGGFVAMAARPQGDGYWLLRSNGDVLGFGAAPALGGPSGGSYLAIAADGPGYRVLGDRPGDVTAFG